MNTNEIPVIEITAETPVTENTEKKIGFFRKNFTKRNCLIAGGIVLVLAIGAALSSSMSSSPTQTDLAEAAATDQIDETPATEEVVLSQGEPVVHLSQLTDLLARS